MTDPNLLVRSLLMLAALAVILLLCYDFLRLVQQRRRTMALLAFLALWAAYALFPATARAVPLPVWAMAPMTALLGLAAEFLRKNILAWSHSHITPRSIRQSMDNLSVGLCYSWPGGLPKLINNRMACLCRELTGSALVDADAFWAALEEGQVPPGARAIQTGERPIVALSGGEVYGFVRRTLTLDDHPIFELIATDVTEEYAVSLELQEKKARADQVNKRLRSLSKTITAMTVERETLAAKTRIHDELGKTLLAAKRYLYETGNLDSAELRKQWQRVNYVLKNEGPTLLQDAYLEMVRSAWLLGIDVKLEGELPTTGSARDLAILAVNTCLTNTLRHAGGSEMFVRCTDLGEMVQLRIQNSGRQPHGPISEGGGLTNLRRQIEGAGGSMTVEALPRFTLTVTIPKEVNPYGKRIDR